MRQAPWIYLLLAAAWQGSVLGQEAAPPVTTNEYTVSAAEAAEKAITPTEVIKIWNGKSLDNLYTWIRGDGYEDPRNVFQITDGMLHISGDGWGGILTKDNYRDYHCVLEYRWGDRTWGSRKEKTKDSGLLVHSVGKDGSHGGIWMGSIEVQIIEGGVGDFILVRGEDPDGSQIPISLTCEHEVGPKGGIYWKEGGQKAVFDNSNRKRINWYGRDPEWKDVIGFRGKNDVDSPGKEWTRLEVTCDGGRITTYVNGVKVNEGFDAYPSAGKLQLQTEMAELFVREWKIYPLDKAPKPTAAKQ